jgi:hypothetical protein
MDDGRLCRFCAFCSSQGDNLDNRITVDTYEDPAVFGSFNALDVLGTADGLMGGGSVLGGKGNVGFDIAANRQT